MSICLQRERLQLPPRLVWNAIALKESEMLDTPTPSFMTWNRNEKKKKKIILNNKMQLIEVMNYQSNEYKKW